MNCEHSSSRGKSSPEDDMVLLVFCFSVVFFVLLFFVFFVICYFVVVFCLLLFFLLFYPLICQPGLSSRIWSSFMLSFKAAEMIRWNSFISADQCGKL